MALKNRYILVRRPPPQLAYASATYELELVAEPGTDVPVTQWVFRARKIQRVPTYCVIATALLERNRLVNVLYHVGFSLEHGTAAAKIMDRLVRDGYAEQSRPSRDDF